MHHLRLIVCVCSQNEAIYEEALQQADECYVPADVHAEQAREKRGKREKKVC